MTTRRPPLTTRVRPSSAVYVGADSTYYLSNPPNIPDLPEPPSPGSTSSRSTSVSGLPSPPATNSTGSGSTGDPGSIAVRGGLKMLNGSNIKTFHAAFNGADHHDEQDDYENDNDDDGEDNTARLDHQRRHSASENVLALQRVKSLTQRNRMALDKLSSFSRLSSPSPSTRPSSTTRSPHPPATPSLHASSSNSASNSSHTSSSHSNSSTRPSVRRTKTQDHQSGSETERDDVASSSSVRPITPQPPTARQRLVSAPASPQKHLKVGAASTSSGSASGSSTRSPRRARYSHLSFSTTSGSMSGDGDPSSPEDITHAALAAVASARRSPTAMGGTARYVGGGTRMSPTSTGSGKKRQPLPREWGATGGSSGSTGRFSAEPTSPQRQTSPNKRHSYTPSSTASQSRHAHSNSTSSTSTVGTNARPSTVRELARRHQTRWFSEDMGGGGGERGGGGNANTSVNGNAPEERERQQSLRAGSAESALQGGRSLVGEGLRAAGLAGRGGGGDVFSQERTPARVEWADSTRSRSQSRLGGHGRAATSMADYASPRDGRDGDRGGDADEPRTRGRAGSALGRYRGPSVEREREVDRERYAPSPSPYGSVKRRQGSGGTGQQEHTKLMMDSLGMFEGHLSRVAGGELVRSAQVLVGAAERLNAILRAGTSRALEEQIDAEVRGVDGVAGGDALIEVWRRVGGEYREGLRVSDELVRSVTGFLLGVGRVVRDFGGDGHGHGSDEGRNSASPDVGRALDGRRSAESRRSSEAHDDRRTLGGGRESALGARPTSVLNMRNEAAPPSGPRNPTPASRRLLTPREQRELKASGGMAASDSQETVQPVGGAGYEPSPTPASRKQNQGTLDRSRTLPPISIPKPLPTLPSESTSTLRRNQTVGDKPTGNSERRRRTITSTVRGGPGLFPSTMITPTTALTPHTVSNAPHERGDMRMSFPSMSRNDSDKSLSTRGRNNTVTFSRPSTVALAGLQMQHERERQRTISGGSVYEEQRAGASTAGPSGSGRRRIRGSAPPRRTSGRGCR
ncbi:hypothetical protein B0H10DRAFT_2220896 [Mycena sp. CBHHK59/15]|nr:hypothetical protein B0H10DRAFT_2220896 [Mycena sp. CBHHK59/15]